MMQRRISLHLVLAIAFIFIAGTALFGHKFPENNIQFSNSASSPQNQDATPPEPQWDDAAVHITITETGGSHDEVVAALVHSFGSQPRAVIDLYQLFPRYRITDIMAGFSLTNALPRPRGPQEFIDHGIAKRRPDIFVAGTCELDIIKFKDQLATLLADRKTYMYCVVHHADRWAAEELESAIRPWVEAGMVDFLTLSPHTAEFLKTQTISKWKTTSPSTIHPYVPLFPVALPAAPSGHGSDKEELSFGLQGDYDPARRDYKSIFVRLDSFLKAATTTESFEESGSRDVTMHLLGHGEHPEVPDMVKDHVKFDEQLDYFQFYAIISRTFALLPAFASEEYLDRKASSSVPAALIGGVPLVATQKVLNAYSYMDKEVVWLQGEKESDLDVVGRILKMGPKERRKKKELVRRKCATIVDQNIKTVEMWLEQAFTKIKKE
ncbi:hypothetical protein K440DRAFT_653526 [Wilcoxina mikolae CBS 423.85]|nr:hypothetical protein K440DRAFT_653526 [Wilcoxina mikolae CBS 423.85]